MTYWLVVAWATAQNVPDVEREPLAAWQLGLATVVFIVGFAAIVYATRRRPGERRPGKKAPPHPRDSSWWNP
jgi:hypothetical protein